MVCKLPIFALIVFSLASCALAQAQDRDTWADYKPRTLSSVVKGHTVDYKAGDEGIDIGSTPVKAKVIYTGESRPTPEDERSLIKFWVKSFNLPEEAPEKFRTELLFLEDTVKFWLPVQDVLLPYFSKEMRKGESVNIYAVWIGTTFPKGGNGGQGKHVFIVNEFEKPATSDSSTP